MLREQAAAAFRPNRSHLTLVAGSLAALVYLHACKLLLFRDLEYFGSDMYSFLRMTWSWARDGVVLYDNVYGYHAAVHNYYILLGFYPLTAVLGAYGLFVGLFLAAAAAVIAVARCRTLSMRHRVVVISSLLSPLMYWVLDHPQWGFHPELLYPHLGILLAVALVEERAGFALGAAAVTCLVKEDGAVVCASLLVMYFGHRLLTDRTGAGTRALLVRRLAIGLAACVTVFVIGLGLLHVVQFLVPNGDGQLLSTSRIGEALTIAEETLSGTGNPEWGERLRHGLLVYGAMAVSFACLVGRRSLRYLLVAIPGSIPVVVVLAVSAAPYGFGNLLWPPRVATLLAPLLACLLFVGQEAPMAAPSRRLSPAEEGRRFAIAALVVAVAVSWTIHFFILRSEIDYHIWNRLAMPSLAAGTDTRLERLNADELAFVRCLASELPAATPVLSHGPQSPLFHRQDLSFPGIDANAYHPPLLSVVIGRQKSDPRFADGFHRVVGRLTVSGRRTAEKWVDSCAGGDRAEHLPHAD